MCDPVTATLVVIAVAGAGTAAYGAHQQASAQKKSAKFKAAVSRNNQVIAKRKAENERKRGKQEERNYRSKLEQIKGKQRSGFAGSGVVVDSDSAFEMLGDTAYLGEIDALTIRNNADQRAYGFEVQAMNFEAQASSHTAEAKNIHPWFNATNAFLGGASSSAGGVAGSYNAGQAGAGAGGGAAAGGGGAAAGGGGAAAAASDERLKENIKKVGVSKSGINIYEFKYKNQPQHVFRGVMAQELLESHKEAVILGEDKMYSVDYSLIDVNFEQIK
tara:strand:- start:13879 stop:14700 length:822 start_codon:yes stop_codon:yes gene_type:complete